MALLGPRRRLASDTLTEGSASRAAAIGATVVATAPFVASAWGVWSGLLGLRPDFWSGYLIGHSTLVVLTTAAIRLFFAARTDVGLGLGTVGVSIAPAVVAVTAALSSGVMGAHWTFVLLLGALAVQGAWDIGRYGLPENLTRMRPIVFVTGLLSLLAALIGS